MTVVDMMHELQHFQQLKRAGSLKMPYNTASAYELEVYQFEYRLGLKRGFSQQYMDYLGKQIRHFHSLLQNGD